MLDYLNVSPDDAASSNPQREKGGNREKDTRFFSPNIKNADKEYQARVRQMPQGLDGLKNKLPVSVEQHTHFIKEPESGLYLTVKCRKTLGHKEHCPICEANWAMYNTGQKELKNKAMDRKNQVNHIGNFLIREDITDPSNTGMVKLWRHTNRMHKTLLEPTLSESGESDKKGFRKKKERFVPYSPVNGRDFYVIVTENPENGFPSYDGSYWDEDGLSNLAPTEDEMMAYLEQCHDLREFIDDVKSAEEINRLYMEFNQKLEEKMGARAAGNMTGTQYFVGGNNPASNPTTSTSKVSGTSSTSGADYFTESSEKSEEPNVFDLNEGSPEIPQAPAVDEPMLSGSDEDEELPF